MRNGPKSEDLDGIANSLDTFTSEERSRIMALVHSKDTTPEIRVRSLLHRMGYRFRLHVERLPGHPDIVLPRYSTVIFVHGCFWHRHSHCKRASTPASNRAYWLPKFERTTQRDRANRRALQRLGWRVLIIWECQIDRIDTLSRRLARTLV